MVKCRAVNCVSRARYGKVHSKPQLSRLGPTPLPLCRNTSSAKSIKEVNSYNKFTSRKLEPPFAEYLTNGKSGCGYDGMHGYSDHENDRANEENSSKNEMN